jgi:DnaJ homolog subfamily C member 19
MNKLLLLAAIGFGIYLYARRTLATPRGMSVDDAAKMLGIATGADNDAVIEAHRRLIAKVHPDAGGTDALAAQINQARDTMLQRIRR